MLTCRDKDDEPASMSQLCLHILVWLLSPSWCRWPVPPPTSPRPPPSHSLSPLTLLLISCSHPFLLLQVCVMLAVSRLFSPANRFRYEKDAFCADALIGCIIKYWKLVQSRIFGEKFGKSGMWANQLSPHLLELSTFVVAVSSVSLLIRSYKEEMAKNDSLFNG